MRDFIECLFQISIDNIHLFCELVCRRLGCRRVGLSASCLVTPPTTLHRVQMCYHAISQSIIIGPDRGDLTLSIITLLTVRSPIWNYLLKIDSVRSCANVSGMTPKSEHDFLHFIVLLCSCVVACPYMTYFPTVMVRNTAYLWWKCS